MKTIKKILSLVVIISMLASLLITTSYASSEVTYTLDIINYTDANGDALLTLDGATAIKVNSAVTASASTDIMFVAALYNGDTLVKTSGKATVTAAAGTKADLSATITLDAALPTPATGYKVKTFVWEESEKTPVIPANVFPNSDVALASVTVDGTEIEVADTMTYKVAIDQMVAPKVIAKAKNASTKVSVTNPVDFPGSATITLTANDGTEKDYVINYTAPVGVTQSAPASNRIGRNFHAADDPDALVVSDSFTTPTSFAFGSWFLADRGQYYKETSAEVKGKFIYFNDIRTISDTYDYLHGTDYIMSAVANEAVTFTLQRDAVVRVFSSAGTLTDETGWSKESKMDYMTASVSRGQGMPEGYNSLSPACSGQSLNTMHYKTVSAGESVTIGCNTFNRIIVIDYLGYLEEPETALASLSIGGDTVKSAELRNTVFTYAVAGDEDAVPSVEATAIDENAEVEIIYPGIGNNGNIFPGKTIVRVTNGSKSKDYIVKYTTSDALLTTSDVKYGTNFHAADDYNANIISGAPYGSQLFQDRSTPNGTAYTNDVRTINEDWDYLNGTDYFMSSVNGSRAVSFVLNRDAVVRMFSQGSATIDGWTRESNAEGYLIATTTTGQISAETGTVFSYMHYKSFMKGETVSFTLNTQNALAVVDYAGYTKTAVSLETLEVGGEAKTIGAESTFTHPVAVDALTCPTVVATAADPGATVEVIYPGQQNNPNVFPGKTVIRVTKGDMTKDYEVQYTVSGNKLTATAGYYGTDFHAADDENASVVSGYVVGSQLYYNRSTPTTNTAGLAYYNDIRTISDEWDYLNGTDYFMSNVGGNVTSGFELNRDAVVRVFSQGSAAVTAEGWTREYKADGYMTASTTSGEGSTKPASTFSYMYYKSFKAGDTVSVTTVPQESILVVDYANYLETFVALESLTVGGEAKEIGLNTSWTHPVAADATVCPAVEVTTMDPNATVDVIYPFEEGNVNVFPGKTIIRVTNGSDSAEYEVQYTCDDFVGYTNASSTGGRTDYTYFGTNFHEPGDFGLTYGSQLYYDRIGTPQGNISYYNDVREFADEIDHLKGTDYIMSNRNQGASVTHNFTLTRPAIVRVLSSDSENFSALSDYEVATNANGFAKISYTLGSGVEGHESYCPLLSLTKMCYKSFDAGAQVAVTIPNSTAIAAIEYTGYTAAE